MKCSNLKGCSIKLMRTIFVLFISISAGATYAADTIEFNFETSRKASCDVYAAYWDGNAKGYTCRAAFTRQLEDETQSCKDGGYIRHVRHEDSHLDFRVVDGSPNDSKAACFEQTITKIKLIDSNGEDRVLEDYKEEDNETQTFLTDKVNSKAGLSHAYKKIHVAKGGMGNRAFLISTSMYSKFCEGRNYYGKCSRVKNASKVTSTTYSGLLRNIKEPTQTGKWYWKTTDDGEKIYEPFTNGFGEGHIIPLLGDFDGDGRDDLAYFEPVKGMWHIDLGRNKKVNYTVGPWGKNEGDVPLVGDFDGDGIDGFAFFRRVLVKEAVTVVNGNWDPIKGEPFYNVLEPAEYVNRWYIDNDRNGITDDKTDFYKSEGYTPLVGDFDGDGVDGFAYYKSGKWYINNSQNSVPDYTVERFGTKDDIPVVGDFDGNGVDGFAILRYSNPRIEGSMADPTPYITHEWHFDNDRDGYADGAPHVIEDVDYRNMESVISGDTSGNGVDSIGLYRGFPISIF